MNFSTEFVSDFVFYRSSITRMSVEQKATLPLKNAEEERAQMDALRPPVVDEKDEERKEEEESVASEEATKSETGQNHHFSCFDLFLYSVVILNAIRCINTSIVASIGCCCNCRKEE